MAQPIRTRSARIVPTGERDLARFADALRAVDRDLKAVEAVFGSVSDLAALVTAGGIAIGTWTPTFTFTTPGDLSVSYSRQQGLEVRIGKAAFVSCDVRFTPTYTTASGNPRVTGMTYVSPTGTGAFAAHGLVAPANTNLGYPAGASHVFANITRLGSAAAFGLFGAGSGVLTELSTTQVPTATEQRWVTMLMYLIET